MHREPNPSVVRSKKEIYAAELRKQMAEKKAREEAIKAKNREEDLRFEERVARQQQQAAQAQKLEEQGSQVPPRSPGPTAHAQVAPVKQAWADSASPRQQQRHQQQPQRPEPQLSPSGPNFQRYKEQNESSSVFRNGSSDAELRRRRTEEQKRVLEEQIQERRRKKAAEQARQEEIEEKLQRKILEEQRQLRAKYEREMNASVRADESIAASPRAGAPQEEQGPLSPFGRRPRARQQYGSPDDRPIGSPTPVKRGGWVNDKQQQKPNPVQFERQPQHQQERRLAKPEQRRARFREDEADIPKEFKPSTLVKHTMKHPAAAPQQPRHRQHQHHHQQQQQQQNPNLHVNVKDSAAWDDSVAWTRSAAVEQSMIGDSELLPVGALPTTQQFLSSLAKKKRRDNTDDIIRTAAQLQNNLEQDSITDYGSRFMSPVKYRPAANIVPLAETRNEDLNDTDALLSMVEDESMYDSVVEMEPQLLAALEEQAKSGDHTAAEEAASRSHADVPVPIVSAAPAVFQRVPSAVQRKPQMLVQKSLDSTVAWLWEDGKLTDSITRFQKKKAEAIATAALEEQQGQNVSASQADDTPTSSSLAVAKAKAATTLSTLADSYSDYSFADLANTVEASIDVSLYSEKPVFKPVVADTGVTASSKPPRKTWAKPMELTIQPNDTTQE
jgi:hypothetical protein